MEVLGTPPLPLSSSCVVVVVGCGCSGNSIGGWRCSGSGGGSGWLLCFSLPPLEVVEKTESPDGFLETNPPPLLPQTLPPLEDMEEIAESPEGFLLEVALLEQLLLLLLLLKLLLLVLMEKLLLVLLFVLELQRRRTFCFSSRQARPPPPPAPSLPPPPPIEE